MTHYHGRLAARRPAAYDTVSLPGRRLRWPSDAPVRRWSGWLVSRHRTPAARAWRVRMRLHQAAAWRITAPEPAR